MELPSTPTRTRTHSPVSRWWSFTSFTVPDPYPCPHQCQYLIHFPVLNEWLCCASGREYTHISTFYPFPFSRLSKSLYLYRLLVYGHGDKPLFLHVAIFSHSTFILCVCLARLSWGAVLFVAARLQRGEYTHRFL